MILACSSVGAIHFPASTNIFESFFGKTEEVFDILNAPFRHGEIVFDASAVICHYEIEHVPLFDPSIT